MRTRTFRKRPPRLSRPSNKPSRRLANPGDPCQPRPPAPLKPGDFVVTVVDKVEIGVKGSQGEIVPKGTKLKVLEIRGAWIGVRIDGKDKTGWVLGEQVSRP